jgi:hypothetical protein
LQANDFKALVNKVIRLLDLAYWDYGNHTNTEQAIKETELTDSIQSILEYANKYVLRNFQYQLTIDYEDDRDAFKLCHTEDVQ